MAKVLSTLAAANLSPEETQILSTGGEDQMEAGPDVERVLTKPSIENSRIAPTPEDKAGAHQTVDEHDVPKIGAHTFRLVDPT